MPTITEVVASPGVTSKAAATGSNSTFTLQVLRLMETRQINGEAIFAINGHSVDGTEMTHTLDIDNTGTYSGNPYTYFQDVESSQSQSVTITSIWVSTNSNGFIKVQQCNSAESTIQDLLLLGGSTWTELGPVPTIQLTPEYNLRIETVNFSANDSFSIVIGLRKQIGYTKQAYENA